MTIKISFQNPYPSSTVKELLEDHLLIPRKIRHFLRIKKHVLINREVINWQSPVEKGAEVTLLFDDDDYPEKTIPFGDKTLVEPLFEDEQLIIVNKPEGMKTHANQPQEIALLNHVSAYVGKTCYVVHRLDKETSGAIVFAKTPFILPILNRMLEDKAIKRDYWALVAGSMPKTVTYRDKIGRHRHDRRKRIVDPRAGQKSVTHIKCLKHYGKVSLVNCQLETGRTHQIRVHLAHHGHALLGDPLYNPNSQGRLMLHAHRLTLTHPLTNQVISVKAKSTSFEQALTTFKTK